ncbi:response regulator receiver domain-containing protein [Dyadobacter jejuensis]|uniref:Response regulator receiver domain-containing protein n=1 Tax=Dyadobacter jejuensis TaxID=1082580 RepID=A0A316ARX8_9BACT|nr:response regulator [Dyadobacter jejuensis]PWJ60258.1 response regulator receiver domain-containing protein [Dyadobacter jejuensis]
MSNLPTQLSVMMVEDDPIFVMLLKRLLKKSNLDSDPLVFESGKVASQYIISDIDKNTNVLLFLDLNMPVYNGWDLLSSLEGHRQKENTWIVITSSSIDQQDLDRAKKNPLVLDFLTKPLTLEHMEVVKQKISSKIVLN